MPDRNQFRDTSRYLAAVASEIAYPALRAYAGTRARRPAVPAHQWRRGVILGSGHIGDVLYRTCSLDHLARELPQCSWSYVTTLEGAEILRGNPSLEAILPLNSELATDFISPAGVRQLDESDFDVALCTDNIEHHTALWLATKLGIPNRVAFVQKGFSGLATIRVRTPRASWPAQIRSMMNTVTGSADPSPLRPRIYFTADDMAEARREWESLELTNAPLTIAVSLTSRQRLGVFPASLFVGILRHTLALQPDARIVLCGSASDSAPLQEAAAMIGSQAIVRAGTLSIRAFAAFLSLCDAFLGADSGPRHMANAANIPVFFVRNLAVPEIEAGAYCDTEVDLAPAGQYLSDVEATRRLDFIDQQSAARALLSAATLTHSRGRALR